MAETPIVPAGSTVVRDLLVELGDAVRGDFTRNRRVMSFSQYLDLVVSEPTRQLRSSTQYIVDCFDHYGTEMVKYPWGEVRRFTMFDAPWDKGADMLFGQEPVQNAVYRTLRSFVQDGRPNKLILLHGPNGSAKSTFIRCLGRALENYSTLEAGALYRFSWIFPAQKHTRGGIGFGGNADAAHDSLDSFAYLPDDLIDARLGDELRDHPLLLIPNAGATRCWRGGRIGGTTTSASPSSTFGRRSGICSRSTRSGSPTKRSCAPRDSTRRWHASSS